MKQIRLCSCNKMQGKGAVCLINLASEQNNALRRGGKNPLFLKTSAVDEGGWFPMRIYFLTCR